MIQNITNSLMPEGLAATKDIEDVLFYFEVAENKGRNISVTIINRTQYQIDAIKKILSDKGFEVIQVEDGIRISRPTISYTLF